MANGNNPAGRLLYWLKLGRARPHANSAMAEWCIVFGLDQSKAADRVECMRRGAMLMGLAQEVRREAEQLPADYHPDVMLEHFNEVETALDQFTILPSTTIGNMFAQMAGTGWQSLAMLDAMLSSHRPEAVVNEDTVRDHLGQVRALIDAILEDHELDAGLKRYVIARLRDVEKALTDSFITGSGGLELAANSLLGAARRQPDWWDRIARTKWAPRIGAVWVAIVTSLGVAGGVPALMPGDAQPIVIEQMVEVDNTDTHAHVVNRENEGDPVETELLDMNDQERHPGAQP